MGKLMDEPAPALSSAPRAKRHYRGWRLPTLPLDVDGFAGNGQEDCRRAAIPASAVENHDGARVGAEHRGEAVEEKPQRGRADRWKDQGQGALAAARDAPNRYVKNERLPCRLRARSPLNGQL